MALNLGEFLEETFSRFHQPTYLDSDPIVFVHQGLRKKLTALDLECIALISALLAYGNVKQIKASVQSVLDRLIQIDSSPAQAILKSDFPEKKRILRGWKHRFQTDADLCALLLLIERSWKTFGSLGMQFRQYLEGQTTIEAPLNAFIHQWKVWANEDSRIKPTAGFLFLLNAPVDGSCCKRWCMFLRWMGRKDAIDPGLWSDFLKPSHLIIPLDTHTAAIARALGLLRRQTASWKGAVEVTAALREFDPLDPVRFDFALARLGIVEKCQKKFVPQICPSCEMVQNCRMISRK